MYLYSDNISQMQFTRESENKLCLCTCNLQEIYHESLVGAIGTVTAINTVAAISIAASGFIAN
jgi:hypothetical protein